jgi:NAD(P)-dependent dehydrogenase (short-subunit alcohol dehydrogenase family)
MAVLLVAGGSRGIGAATARLAAKHGYDVAVNYLGNAKAADDVVKKIEAAGRRAVALQGDMGREADVERVFDETARRLGHVSHFVHSAGIVAKSSKLADASTETLRNVVDVNLMGALLCCRAAVRRMSTAKGGQGGSIVLLSSMAAQIGGANEYVVYAAAKGGVDTLTLGLAREVVKEGVRVNAIRPGLINTDIHEPGRLERVTPTVPMGRAGEPDEVAAAILFLLSDAASYITGSVLNVSGGR